MADFIVQLESGFQASRLLALLRQPYGNMRPPGWAFTEPWGSAAVLQDPIASSPNWISAGNLMLAWIGDVVPPSGTAQFTQALVGLDALAKQEQEGVVLAKQLSQSVILPHFNGAFALLVLGRSFFAVATDPMASVQIYVGKGSHHRVCTVGTHPDLVACATGVSDTIDPVSICDFLSNGISCCPHTMHRNVTELEPGTLLWVQYGREQAPVLQQIQYWIPPREMDRGDDLRELTERFIQSWHKAVDTRCQGDRLAVQLSGGFDSRLVLAAIPPEKYCLGLTLGDAMNRETRFARRVAMTYRREWVPLWRDAEYLGRTASQAIRFTGCEGEWHHGHCLGFADRICELKVQSVFTGLLMDNNFKGYYAQDVRRVPRWGGLLPARYDIVPIDYAGQLHPFCRSFLAPQLGEGVRARRHVFLQRHFAGQRQSACEWLDGYPYSQASDNTGWVIERRLMPLRLPVMDRALVELAFQVPMSLKAGGQFFDQAIVRILGPGLSIPSANDGVRAGSGHISRLAQRGLRKLENAGRQTLLSVGARLPVPHSWHDFELYWRDSSVLRELRSQHGRNLREWAGPVFRGDPLALLEAPSTSWQVGSRLLQLAVWQSILKEYCLPTTNGSP